MSLGVCLHHLFESVDVLPQTRPHRHMTGVRLVGRQAGENAVQVRREAFLIHDVVLVVDDDDDAIVCVQIDSTI